MRLSLPGRIFGAFAALLLVFAAVSAFTAWKIADLSTQVAGIHHNLLPLPALLAEVKSELRGLDLALEPREAPQLRRTVHLARRVHPYLTRLDEQFSAAADHLDGAAGDPAAGASAGELAQRWHALDATRLALAARVTAFFDRVEAEPEPAAEPADDTALAQSQRALRRDLAELGREVVHVELDLHEALGRAMDAFAQQERSAVWSIVLLTALGIALGIALTAAAALALKPLRTLRAAVERIARGDFDEPIGLSPHTDLGALAADINRMAEAIRNRDAQLAEQQRELLHQERLATVGRLAAQITHELRNPLSSIGLNSELLMDELIAPEQAPARALLGSIIQEVERLREITESYLGFARIPRPEPVPTDLNALATETLEFVRTEMERVRVKARLDPDRGGGAALVDPHQLRAALLNLLRNAREALEARGGGHVTVRVRTLGDGATLEVQDDGPGFSADARAHLFEPFYSTKPQGTGLGLSYVRKLLVAQDGHVEIEGAPGGGALVRLRLPLAQE